MHPGWGASLEFYGMKQLSACKSKRISPTNVNETRA